jgi:DNA-binding response OmpR family regulator
MASILLVDDDRVLSHLVATLLREKGHKLFAAFDAVQAMMIAMRQPLVDAIVLDVNMPGGSGEETLRKLKMSSRTANIPVIILSGSIDLEGQNRVRTLGAAAVLSKPLVPEELFGALNAALRSPPAF